MKTKLFSSIFIIAILSTSIYYTQNKSTIAIDNNPRPTEEHEEEDNQEEKTAPWSLENASHHQDMIEKYMLNPEMKKASSFDGSKSYAGGKLRGRWAQRAAKNMPGAYAFSEMLDGTDTIYGVTLSHFSGEYNAKAYIYKGTVYNPKSGTKGDDFVCLTAHWPNRYQDLIAFKYNNKTRLVAGISKNSVYYSDDEGKTWTRNIGLPNAISNTIINRQNNKIYATNNRQVYISTDGAKTFSVLQNLVIDRDTVLYSPRYDSQADASTVYMARNKEFYELKDGESSFIKTGAFTEYYTSYKKFSIGGDSRKLYVTTDSKYWVSTDKGKTWSEKFPKGNSYGGRNGAMSAGKHIGVSPKDPNHVIGGYVLPVYSTNGLDSDSGNKYGWSRYQGGSYLSRLEYYDRIRFHYHPDFHANQFFYNSSGDLFSMHSGDGGLIMSYKDWFDHPAEENYDTDSYADAHFINITTLNSTNQLVYRRQMFTGYKDEKHLFYGTQDQGTLNASKASEQSGDELLDVRQSRGGDGIPILSTDGKHAWSYARRGNEVNAPVKVYKDDGSVKTATQIVGDTRSPINPKLTFEKNSQFGWTQNYIDHDAPDKRMWVLSKKLHKAEVQEDGSLSGTTISRGEDAHQVTAIAQAHKNPNKIWFLQEAKVFKSTDRGDSFDYGTQTPFELTADPSTYGSGWVLPSDDNYILFCGPSKNSVGSILSKDGGNTWIDVTGNFPAGDSLQISGLVGTPDSKYIFAGTDKGPWVFVVESGTWYPIGADSGYFNTTVMEYIASTNSIRFGTWGSGIFDFKIQNTSSSQKVNLGFIPLLLLD